MRRRQFLNASALACGLMTPAGSLLGQSRAGANRLHIPPLDRGIAVDSGRRYELIAQSGQRRFLADQDTPTLGFNGDYLGPTLSLRRDDLVRIRVQNRMAEATTVHWHGLHVPAREDGGPHQVVSPGGDWEARFRVSQAAGTFWYHSHLLGESGSQIYRGLAGMILVQDETSDRGDLPSEYGVDDIPLILQDRRFNSDGSFRYVQAMPDIMTGVFGDQVLVNGTANALFAPASTRVRFRLLNAANARSFVLGFEDQREFSVIGSGGGLLEKTSSQRQLILAPAERAEIVVDFSDGAPVNLVSSPMPGDSGFAARGMMARMHGINSERQQVLAIEPQSALARSPSLPGTLRSIEPLTVNSAQTERRFVLSMAMGMGRMGGGAGGRTGMFAINGQAMDMAVINERIPVDSTEIWEVRNDSMMLHPFHVHHGLFQLLDRDGRAPRGMETGELDTVKVGPGETVRLIMRFSDFADADTPYMYHCHILEHEDNGMMGQFTVE